MRAWNAITSRPAVYLIASRNLTGGRPLEQVVTAALRGGARLVQMREKGLTRDEALIEGRALAELCRVCQLPAEQVFELVEHSVIEPLGQDPSRWRFRGISVRRVRLVQRLERDLGVNVAGAALALDLLEELERLRTRLRRFES